MDSSVQSIFVLSSLLRCCDLHVHDCFSGGWQFSPTWFFTRRNSYAILLSLAALWDMFRKLCCVLNYRDPHCVCQRKFHSVMLLSRMDQCSRRALNLSDRSLANCVLLRFRSRHRKTTYVHRINLNRISHEATIKSNTFHTTVV